MKNIIPSKMVLCTHLLLLAGLPLYFDAEHPATIPIPPQTTPVPQKSISERRHTFTELNTDLGNMQKNLRQAQEIRFCRLDKSATPFAILSEKSHPHMFHLAKQIVFDKQKSFPDLPYYTALFYQNGKAFSVAIYFPDYGALEIYGQRGALPQELADWLFSLIGNSPSYNKYSTK